MSIIRENVNLRNALSVVAEVALELVENGIIFVKVTEFALQMIVHIDSVERSALHCHVPYF